MSPRVDCLPVHLIIFVRPDDGVDGDADEANSGQIAKLNVNFTD